MLTHAFTASLRKQVLVICGLQSICTHDDWLTMGWNRRSHHVAGDAGEDERLQRGKEEDLISKSRFPWTFATASENGEEKKIVAAMK